MLSLICENCLSSLNHHKPWIQNIIRTMMPINLSKKGSSFRSSTGLTHAELDGIAQKMGENKDHLSLNVDTEKIRRNYILPTNAFGEIEFTGMNQSAKVI